MTSNSPTEDTRKIPHYQENVSESESLQGKIMLGHQLGKEGQRKKARLTKCHELIHISQ